MKKTLKTAGRWLLALTLFAGSGIHETAEAKTTVTVSKRTAPPRRVEVKTLRPSVHHIWIGGQWTIGFNGITWVSGYWKAPVVRHVRKRVVHPRPVRLVKSSPVKVVRKTPSRRTSPKAVKAVRK